MGWQRPSDAMSGALASHCMMLIAGKPPSNGPAHHELIERTLH